MVDENQPHKEKMQKIKTARDKIIQSKMPNFKKNMSVDEVSNIIIELRNIDIIVKSSSLDSKLLFYPFIIKVCKGFHGHK